MEAFVSAYPVQDHPICVILSHVTARGDSLVIGRIISKRNRRSLQVLCEVV